MSDAVDTNGLTRHELGPDPLVLVVAREHAWARRERMRFSEAVQAPWIAWGEQSALSSHLLLRAVASGVQLVPRLTYRTAGGVLQLVARGVGFTILPEHVLHQQSGGEEIACLRLEDLWARRRLLACHSAQADPVRKNVAEQIVRHWVSQTGAAESQPGRR